MPAPATTAAALSQNDASRPVLGPQNSPDEGGVEPTCLPGLGSGYSGRVPAAESKLVRAVATLRRTYGDPPAHPARGPLEMILFENVAYLADDAKRARAWDLLRRRVGTRPEQILEAPSSVLLDVARAGILAADRVERIREIARIALDEFDGDLAGALDGPIGDARKALKKFPSIGDPGAEKVLLFARRDRVLALDSNGLRVLLRLGYGTEDRNYARAYRSAQEASRSEWKDDFDWLIAAHQLLRRHGKELCKATHPRCEACPLRKVCAYYRALPKKA